MNKRSRFLKQIHAFPVFFTLLMLISYQEVRGHGIQYHEFSPIDHRLGLDASAVNCVVQDMNGLIWLGTDHGLYSFDGYLARHYPVRPSINQGNDGVVYCAYLIDTCRIWLGTDNGLYVFNTYTDKYEQRPLGLPENIRAISRISERLFWIGSINGLYRYDAVSGNSERIMDKAIPHQAMYSMLKYDDNTYYLGTYNGLCKFTFSTGTFESIPLSHHSSTNNQVILSLLPDYERNCVWVGVEGGLVAYNATSGVSTATPLFNGNSVKSLLLDNQKCLWVGTDNGLFIYDPTTQKYRLIRHDALNDRSLVNNVVWSIFTDKEKNIWVGTDAGASLYINNDQFKIQSISELTGSNEGNYIISILTDRQNNLWLGGNNGLIKVDRPSNKTTWFQQNNTRYSLPHNKVRSIFEDGEGDIWLATDGSICRYEQKNNRFIRYQIEDDTHTRNANWSYAICQDETQKLWIATCLGGLFVVDKQKLIAAEGKTYVAEKNYYNHGGFQGLSGNMLQFLATDQYQNVWVGTYKAGIDLIDRTNQKVVQFTATSETHSLPSDEVSTLLVDSENRLWIALRNQVIRMNPRTFEMKVLTDPRLTDSYINALADDGKRIWMGVSSGLFFIDKASLKIQQINYGGSYFSSIAYHKSNNRVVAGGQNEFVEFEPDNLLAESPQNNLFITALWINDLLVHEDSTTESPLSLNQSIRFTHSIALPYKLNNLTFRFSEYSYNRQQNVQYAHKLEGLDNTWHLTSPGINRITYNNLKPGTYVLTISGIGSDGTPLPNPLAFTIQIDHPWYATWIAKGVYLLALIFLLIALMNYAVVLNRLRFERLEKAKTMELTAHKIDFLTNISHELKTPLSLIIGPLGKIIDQIKTPALKEQLTDVRHHALKMGQLIHQLMEASRQEFDALGLIISNVDIVAFVNSVISVFEKPLSDRSVSIEFESTHPTFFLEADVLKLEIILNNVLSNASKFAPNHSVISVKLNIQKEWVQIRIADQGPGIDTKDLPHVFDRFFQSQHTISKNKEGTGVGLSIVKEYIELHRGTATVTSDGHHGTCVELNLPVTQPDAFKEGKHSTIPAINYQDPTSKPLLLIVEDNVEISAFISKSLGNEFRCISAPNGKLGLEIALVQQPDLIITDIMMPVMDGIDMCRKLRENISTSLTPIIMLTAKDDKNTELLGYRTGADAFIAKPFEMAYLADRINHLLKGRAMLMQKVRQEAIIQPREQEVVSPDEKMLTAITQIIETEIANPDLNVSLLSEKSGYSLKQIYRRIKSLTGQTAVDYIRSVRLKKAAMLLSRKTFTVAEVMYMVGFSNHSYFAKRFQEMYGKSPKQYAEDTV